MRVRILVLSTLALSLMSCTKDAPSVGCVIEKAVSGVVAVTIAQQLQCSNQAAIEASIAAAASKAGICKSEPALAIGKPKVAGSAMKSVGSDICGSVAGTLLAGLVNGVVPSEWGCSGESAQASLNQLIAGACAKAFP